MDLRIDRTAQARIDPTPTPRLPPIRPVRAPAIQCRELLVYSHVHQVLPIAPNIRDLRRCSWNHFKSRQVNWAGGADGGQHISHVATCLPMSRRADPCRVFAAQAHYMRFRFPAAPQLKQGRARAKVLARLRFGTTSIGVPVHREVIRADLSCSRPARWARPRSRGSRRPLTEMMRR